MRTVLSVLFVTAAAWPQVPPHTNHLSHTTNGTIMYGAIHFSDAKSTWPQVNVWLGKHFDWVIGGGGPVGQNDGPYQGDAHGGALNKLYWTAYTDMAGTGLGGMYNIQAKCTSAGQDYERAMLHSSLDMRWGDAPGGVPIKLLNVKGFDMWEEPFNGNLVQGIFTANGGTFADVTNSLYHVTPVTVSDTLYIGLQVPFDQAAFTITKPRTGGSVSYNYWNGSTWKPLSDHLSDATHKLANNGTISFYPPSDWASRSLTVKVATPQKITTTHVKYWLQVVVAGSTTPPVVSSILNEDWTIASGDNNARGWNSKDPHRINVGTPVEYNPNPPANATARFKYQSRVPAAKQDILFNPSAPEAATALAGYIDMQIHPPLDNFDGAFLDDGGRTPYIPLAPKGEPIYLSFFDYDFEPKNKDGWDGWYVAQGKLVAQIKSVLKSEHGANFWVTSNGIVPTAGPNTGLHPSPLTDALIIEAFTTPFGSGGCTYHIGGGCPYDYALPGPTNVNNTRFYFQSIDRNSFSNPWDPHNSSQFTRWHPQDNAQRTPMSTLIQHYIGSNANTGFMYYGSLVNIDMYIQLDQVYAYNGSTTLTSNISADPKPRTPKTFTIAPIGTCYGAYLGLGAKHSGDTVIGKIGNLWLQDGDFTLNLRQTELSPSVLPGYPHTIYAGDVNKFGSIKVQLGGSTTQIGAANTWEYWNGSKWSRLAVRDGTGNFKQSGTISFTPPSDWVMNKYQGISNYWVRSVDLYSAVTVQTMFSPEWSTVTTMDPIFNSYASGSGAHCIDLYHLAIDPVPPSSNVYSWTRWFPAMETDIGLPDKGGVGGGLRMVTGAPIKGLQLPPWKTGGPPDNISGQASCPKSGPMCADLWRRDFTKAVILYRPYNPSTVLESEMDQYSQAISLGGTYYPLQTDGTTAAGVTSIKLRGGEGAILMKSPVTTAMTVNPGLHPLGVHAE